VSIYKGCETLSPHHYHCYSCVTTTVSLHIQTLAHCSTRVLPISFKTWNTHTK